MGRPSFSPTDEQRRTVKVMAGLGSRHDDIAVVLDISARTLRKHFRRELDRGTVEANAQVMQTLFRMATSGKNTPATIFWAKTRCGLRERSAPPENSPPPAMLVHIEGEQK